MEQNFIGHTLLHKYEHINNKYTYIGMYEWTDNSSSKVVSIFICCSLLL